MDDASLFIDNTLIHFGKKGMRWGIRNEDPSSGGTSSKSEIPSGGMSSRQKKLLIGAGVTVGLLAAYGGYRMLNKSGSEAFKVDNSLSGKMSANEIMKKVTNPINRDFSVDPRATINCRRCTFAYEMRRRGYDVVATKNLRHVRTQDAEGLIEAINPTSTSTRRFIDALTPAGLGRSGIKLVPSRPGQNASRIFNSLSKQPEGARGELAMSWRGEKSCHSMAWEIIRGKPHIIDAQTNDLYSTPQRFHSVAKHIEEAALTRLDNVELNEPFLKKWVTNDK
jgi:hypothetical protein